MNDPAMMAAANEAFSKMSDEQRRQMQEQVSRFTPEQIAQMQATMNGMSPEQRAQMAEMASNATPEELLQRSQQAASMMPNGTVSESERLKSEGNALVGQKRYEEASAKYLQALQTPGCSLETTKAAHLNLSMCYLNLERYDDVVQRTSTVIKMDRSNMKALYRRGQAFIFKKNKTRAVSDLERALALCGESDRASVAERLEAARRMEDVEPVEVAVEDEIVIEDVEFEEVAAPPAAPTMPTMPPQMPPQMDPAQMKQAASMMEGMSDEQLEEMLKMGGAPAGVSAAQMRSATKMMANMAPEDVKRMTDMAQKFQATGGANSTRDMAELAKDPDMVKSMTNMMKSMDPVELASMMSASGVKVTADQAKAMRDQLGSMDEKTLERLAKVATFFGKLVALFQRAKMYCRSNPAMALAILVLIVALVLRWKGIM